MADPQLDLVALAPVVCPPEALGDPYARALAERLAQGTLAYARLVACRRGDEAEVVEFEVEPEVSQHRVYDIRPMEPLALYVDRRAAAAGIGPRVLALRPDFPSVPHLYMETWVYPRSLCLYTVAFREIAAQWTPARFIARVREWLRLNARGELHAAGQPLEPLIGGARGRILLPHAVRDALGRAASDPVDARGATLALDLARLSGDGESLVLAATPGVVGRAKGGGPGFVARVITTAPRVQGAVRRMPRTLRDAHELLAECGDDLLGALRLGVWEWERSPAALGATLVLVVLLPRSRDAGAESESLEAWTFVTDHAVAQLGEAIGAWALHEGVPGRLLAAAAECDGRDVQLHPLYPTFALSRDDAARFNGRVAADDTRVVAIGCGALGSQVTLHAARAAVGRWTLIDDDRLLPHNLARHALPGDAVGFEKATSVAMLANGVTDDGDAEPAFHAVPTDVLRPGAHAQALERALAEAAVVLDMSASVPVARALTRDVNAGARRVSLFLNPSGRDLTLLAEDAERAIPLDLLEMQYYRALLRRPELESSLAGVGPLIRYGRSCRDVSAVLPQAVIAAHAAIGARAVEHALTDPGARIRLWRLDDDTLGVTPHAVEPAAMRACALAGPGGTWTIVTDAWFLDHLAGLRAAKLPNETGGVLIGAFDLSRRLIYLVDTIASPPDSRERRTQYVRGAAGLTDEIARIEETTAGQLHYVGEWHAHPDDYSCRPSGDDAELFRWLTERMEVDGVPALMLIVGEGGLAVPYLGVLPADGTYPAMLLHE